jgi:hypothetical protein
VKADQGQVTKVEIKGSSATATAKDGSKHDVQLPDTGTDFLQQQLYLLRTEQGVCGHDQRGCPAQAAAQAPAQVALHQVASRSQGESDDQLPALGGNRWPASPGRRPKTARLRVTTEPLLCHRAEPTRGRVT